MRKEGHIEEKRKRIFYVVKWTAEQGWETDKNDKIYYKLEMRGNCEHTHDS